MWRRPTGHRGWAAVSGKTHVTTLLWRQEKRPKTSLGRDRGACWVSRREELHTHGWREPVVRPAGRAGGHVLHP